MNQTFPVTGQLTVDLEAGTFTLSGSLQNAPPEPPTPPTPTIGDQIDMGQVMMTRDSPDVRDWPIGATLTSLTLSFASNGNDVDFTKRYGPGAWPFITGPEGGDLQYTLWVACFISGHWWASAVIPCISRGPNDNYVPTGPTLQPGQLPQNWYYFAGGPLDTYQPQPAELVAWFLTSGDQRRGDISSIHERTQIVLAPFSPGTFTF